MRKIALSLVLSFAFVGASVVVAQDGKKTCSEKPKTEQSKSCCSKKAEKKSCDTKTQDSKKECASKKECKK